MSKLTNVAFTSPIETVFPFSIADVNGDHEQYTIEKGKTVSIGDVKATFVSFDMNQHGQGSQADDQHTRVGSVLTLANASGNETIMPIIVYTRDEPPTHQPFSSKLMNANIQLIGMNVGADKSTVTVEVQRQQSVMQQTETLVVEASIKPFISLVWGGTIVMITGLGLSLFLRGRE